MVYVENPTRFPYLKKELRVAIKILLFLCILLYGDACTHISTPRWIHYVSCLSLKNSRQRNLCNTFKNVLFWVVKSLTFSIKLCEEACD